MAVEGRFYLPGQAGSSRVQLSCREGICRVESENGVLAEESLSRLVVSDRLGNTPRQIRFPDHSMFETTSNDGIDEMLRENRLGRFPSLLHSLESRMRYILPLALLAALAIWFLYAWGIPRVAHTAAYSLPAEKIGIIGEQTMKALDHSMLKPSALSEDEQRNIRTRFEKLAAEVGSGFHYRLYFRRMKGDEANAFALPDGTIVLLDGLVKLAEHPWEIDSVLLHEIGHVEERHALQMSFQDTALTLLVSLMLGDALSVGEAVSSLPLLLIENQYSQAFEQSADDFASNYMLRHQVDTKYFLTMLEKLEASYEQGNRKSDTEKKSTSVWDYFSTHPTTALRVKRLQERKIRNP